jgi:hypothetical protein
MVPQMPFPFPAFSTAEQNSLLSQLVWYIDSVCGEVLTSFQIRQTASLYPIRFEETVTEGKPKE